MTERKPHNSIIVLATLGVYLGLVLVGATPQVLAQAAMARTFDVKDEIEFRENLDKKPENDDEERSPVAASVQVYLEDIEYFLANLDRLRAKGEFDLTRDTFHYSQNAYLPCANGNIAGSYTPLRFDSSSKNARGPIEYFSRGMVYGYSLGDCLSNGAFHATSATDSKFAFSLEKDVFSIQVAVKKDSPQRALALRNELRATLKLYSSTSDNIRNKVIESTKFRAENDQIFIVTRLPRAGLASLLVTSARS